MKFTSFLKLILIFLVLGVLGSGASSQGFPALPEKESPVAEPRASIVRSGFVEEALALAAETTGLDALQAGLLGSETIALQTLEQTSPSSHHPGRRDILINRDFNNRPQNETAVAVNPHNPDHFVAGYNDYRIGTPIGGGFSTSFDRGRSIHDSLVTIPLLTNMVDFPGFVEPPIGTGDPTIAFANDGTVYYASLGFSASFCENGIFVYRSDDGGISWWRPIISIGRGLVDYWPYAFDCSVFLDKEFMTVDTSGGPHDGRIYVTYTRFLFEPGYLESPIYLAYSDDKGLTWTVVGEINGSSADLCEYQEDTTGGSGPGATGPDTTPYDCDENQFSYPVVGPDGTLYVHFFNEQNQSEWQGGGFDGTGAFEFDDQILVVKVDPDTFAVTGPFQVSMVADGLTNYPFSPFNNRQTVCNGGWRLNAAGTIAVGPSNELYVVWADNRNGDEFPFQTFVDPTDGSCPAGLHTSTDVFISKSTDGGMTWTPPHRITHDPPNFDNWFPWVSVGDNGWVWVVYYDRRISGNNTLTDAWVAVSKDGGMTWNEFRVSDKSSDFFDAFFGTPSFIGDYNGIDVANKRGYAFWTDSRISGDSDVFLDIVNSLGH